MNRGEIFGNQLVIDFELLADILSRLTHQTAMMPPFDHALQSEGNQESDGDGNEVDEEIAPTVNWLMRWMNVHYRRITARPLAFPPSR